MEDGEERLSLEQIRAWVEASGEVQFHAQDRAGVVEWVDRTLRSRITPAETQRQGAGAALLGQDDRIEPGPGDTVDRMLPGGERSASRELYRRHRFPKRYTRADIEVLAAVDEAHETLSGPATQKLLQRAWHEFRRGSAMRGWRSSRWRNFIGCERAGRTAIAASTINRPGPRGGDRRAAATPIRKDGPDICASIRCIQGDLDGDQGCLSHQRGGRSDADGRWWARRRRSRSLVAASVGGHAGSSFRSAFGAFIPTTAASSSTHTVAQAAQQTAGGADQVASRATPTTTDWRKPRMAAVIRKHIGYGSHRVGACRGD